QIQLIQAAGGPVLRCRFRIQFLEGLQRGNANFLRMLPAEDFARFENAHQAASGIGRMQSADRFDGFDLKKWAGAFGQIAVNDVLQAAEGVAIASYANFVDYEGRENRINVVDEFQ